MAWSNLGRLLHAKISYQNGICCLFNGKGNFGVVWHGAFQHFLLLLLLPDGKMDLQQNCSAQIWCKKVQTRGWICAKVVNATFAYLFQHGGVNRYRNLAFTTLAQIYSLVCTFLHQICAQQFWCKSIFSSANTKKRRKRK